MPRRRFRGVRFAIERLDPRAIRQLGDVQSPRLEPLLHPQALQRSIAGKGELGVHIVPFRRLLRKSLPGNGSGASVSDRHPTPGGAGLRRCPD